jgi:hypothetical protein
VGFYNVLPKIRTHTVPIRTHIFEISILPFGTCWVPLYPYGTRTRTPDVPGAGTWPKMLYRCILGTIYPYLYNELFSAA